MKAPLKVDQRDLRDLTRHRSNFIPWTSQEAWIESKKCR